MQRGTVRLKETSNHIIEILIDKSLGRWIPQLSQSSEVGVICKVRASIILSLSSNLFLPTIFCFILAAPQIVPFVFVSWLFKHQSVFIAAFLSALYLTRPYLSLWNEYAYYVHSQSTGIELLNRSVYPSILQNLRDIFLKLIGIS